MIFDTHCHLYDPKYEEDILNIISNCFNNNVGLLMLVGDNIIHSKICVNVASSLNKVYASIGIHPMEVNTIEISSLEEELDKLLNNKVKAIGEIGLDYYWDKEEKTKEKQKIYFIKQIEYANKKNLPIIIHARDSVNDCIEILKKHPCLNKGVFHCFSGSLEQMKEVLKLGFYIGLDGPVTYKNAIVPKQIAKEVPLDKLVIETDSPYLPPVPFRGKNNYPYYLKYVIEEISRLKNISEKEIEEVTYQNGVKLFNI